MMQEFKVGDLVQFEDGASLRDGEVVAVIPSKVPYDRNKYWGHSSDAERRDMESTATVRWVDDNSQSDIDMFSLYPRDSELERQFRTESKLVLKQIYDKIDEARTALNEAVTISKKYGIPFHASISPLSNSYFPESFSEKFGEIDLELVHDITGAYSDYTDGGWRHSAVC